MPWAASQGDQGAWVLLGNIQPCCQGFEAWGARRRQQAGSCQGANRQHGAMAQPMPCLQGRVTERLYKKKEGMRRTKRRRRKREDQVRGKGRNREGRGKDMLRIKMGAARQQSTRRAVWLSGLRRQRAQVLAQSQSDNQRQAALAQLENSFVASCWLLSRFSISTLLATYAKNRSSWRQASS
jgi:hypothetical protein